LRRPFEAFSASLHANNSFRWNFLVFYGPYSRGILHNHWALERRLIDVGWDSIATKSGTGDSDASMHKSASLIIMVDSFGVHHMFSAISCCSSQDASSHPSE
jgi:hypothetical protein